VYTEAKIRSLSELCVVVCCRSCTASLTSKSHYHSTILEASCNHLSSTWRSVPCGLPLCVLTSFLYLSGHLANACNGHRCHATIIVTEHTIEVNSTDAVLECDTEVQCSKLRMHLVAKTAAACLCTGHLEHALAFIWSSCQCLPSHLFASCFPVSACSNTNSQREQSKPFTCQLTQKNSHVHCRQG
jgi:hypothetical protein